MPFKSKAQQRWMYSNHPKMAKEWSKETNFKQLPEKKKKKKQEGGYSTEGYKKNSPDKNNSFNIIPSSNITMQGVNHPVIGIDSTGFKQLMMPNKDYKFNSEYVLEIPIKQQGGTINPNTIDRNYGAAPNLTNLQPLQFNPLGSMKQQKEDTNLSYLPMFANSIAAALANRVSNSREKNYEITNLANPLNYIPDTNNTNSYVNYGTPSYQEGGEVNVDQDSEYEDLQDEDFLFEDTPIAQEALPEEQVATPEEVPQEESEFVLPLDESTLQTSEDTNTYEAGSTDAYSNFNKVFSKGMDADIVSMESNGNYRAENPHSSAVGKYQFLWNKWKPEIQKVTGIGNKSTFEDTPEAQEQFYAYYKQAHMAPAIDRLKRYNNKGLTDSQLGKLYHFKGEQGAIDYLIEGVDKTKSNNISIGKYIGS